LADGLGNVFSQSPERFCLCNALTHNGIDNTATLHQIFHCTEYLGFNIGVGILKLDQRIERCSSVEGPTDPCMRDHLVDGQLRKELVSQ